MIFYVSDYLLGNNTDTDAVRACMADVSRADEKTLFSTKKIGC